ncbi:NADP-dependent oxidoreductase [Novosphingobium sp.]|uniref:NADP-dependent oxidoreductase n=1 Tax=Novosphingobium sp. TaxID=1874826 RepID=UPI00286E55A9|nr:NADP-dependent oxidoreductase [Novosphingobium sp.]
MPSSSARTTYREVVLHRRPEGAPVSDDFAVIEKPIPESADGEFLVRNTYVSLDPGLRQRLSQVDSYVALIELGAPLTTTTLGEVVASRVPWVPVGSYIVGFHTVAEFSLCRPGPLTRLVDPAATSSPSHHLSLLGATGLTAYFGMLDIGRPVAGETVLVSAAAGAVGSIAAQIAKIQGCKVIGIAGGAEKCALLTHEFGLDAAIDYRGLSCADLTRAIKAAAPDGIDVFFDNVGGIQLDAALDCLNPGGRVPLCGLISQYNLTAPPPPLTNLFKLIAKSARIEGFTVLTYADRFPEALADLARWEREGQIHFREQIEEGIEQAVPGFLKLFDGRNLGKMMLRL